MINIGPYPFYREANCKQACHGTVTVALNWWRDYFSVATQSFVLNAGQHVTLTVTPTVHSYTPDFKRTLGIEARKCRFLDEVIEGEKSMFNNYTQKACIFDCALKRSLSIANCTPWDFPFLPNVDTNDVPPICMNNNPSYADIFYYTLLDTLHSDYCSPKCLPNCEEIAYEATRDTTTINKLESASFKSGSSRTQLCIFS